MTDGTNGKERIESARRLAKTCDLDVLGWNDRPGEEFLSLKGDGPLS